MITVSLSSLEGTSTQLSVEAPDFYLCRMAKVLLIEKSEFTVILFIVCDAVVPALTESVEALGELNSYFVPMMATLHRDIS